ncbi:hypothetical protein ACJJTC_014909 [Scirpophaga incertulas]
MLKVADVSFPYQKSIIQNISLSRNTIASRIDDLSRNLKTLGAQAPRCPALLPSIVREWKRKGQFWKPTAQKMLPLLINANEHQLEKFASTATSAKGDIGIPHQIMI